MRRRGCAAVRRCHARETARRGRDAGRRSTLMTGADVSAQSSPTSIRTLDGLRLVGTLVVPDVTTGRAVVLVHGGGVTREEGGFFTRLAAGLADAGMASLRFDLRGHGESVCGCYAAKRPHEVTRLVLLSSTAPRTRLCPSNPRGQRLSSSRPSTS